MGYASELILHELGSIREKAKEMVDMALPTGNYSFLEFRELELDLIIMAKKISALMAIVEIQLKDQQKA